MGTEIKSALRPALIIFLFTTLLTGLLYPLAMTGVGQLLFPYRANGSLVRDGGRIVGSELIGQQFAAPRYFHPRPSAAGEGYDAMASSGSNLGPTSADLKASIAERIAAARADGISGAVPADLVTASGSGLDPDISPANARAQVRRVAAARGLDQARLGAVVEQAIVPPLLGLLGEPHVNVLALNRQVDAMTAQLAR